MSGVDLLTESGVRGGDGLVISGVSSSIPGAKSGAADGVQELRSRRRGRRHDVERCVAPVAGHLPAAGGGILRGADGLV
jgi:hypothetical protein